VQWVEPLADVNGKKLAQLWTMWLRSDEGQKCADCSALKAPDEQRAYLENRLWRAYMAGVRDCEKSREPA
jgi:hypothetical protein